MMDHFVLFCALLALFQITFLHGFMIHRFLLSPNPSLSPISALISSFGLSLIVNFVLVLSLNTALCALLGLGVEIRNGAILLLGIIEYALFFGEIRNPQREKWWGKVGAIAFLMPVLFFLWGQIMDDPVMGFLVNDEANAYRTWAIEWASGGFPSLMHHYGQIVSTAWATLYTAMGSIELSFVLKSMMPLFSFYMILLLIEVYQKTRNPVYLLSVFTVWALLALTLWHRTAIWVGRADSPLFWFGFSSMNIDAAVAFFAFVSFCFLLLFPDRLELPFLMAVGAGLTKQAGLYWIFAFPFFVTHPRFLKIKGKIKLWSALLACVSPLYIYNELSVLSGVNDRGNLIDIAERMNLIGPTWVSRIWPAALSIAPFFYSGFLLLGFVALAVIGSRPSRTFSKILILVVIPYTLIWMTQVSYELPNLTLAVPFFGVLVASGLRLLFRMPSTLNPPQIKLKANPLGAPAVLIMVSAILFLSLAPSLDQLTSFQRSLETRYTSRIFWAPVSEHFKSNK